MRLQDKVVIVTGSTSGIGEAIARRVVEEGGRVLVHGLETDLGEAVHASLGDAAALHIDDLTDPESAVRIVAAAIAAFGRVDALVNNAGSVARSNLGNSDADVFDRMMALNLRAPMLMIRAAREQLTAARGAVLNIGSVNAYCGEPNLLVYSMTKGGMMAMTRNLGNALGPDGVRVNQLNVGWTFTANEDRVKQAEGLAPGWQDRVPPQFAPSGTIMRPEQVAAAAVYWIGDESRPVNGSIVDIEQYPVIGRNPPKKF
jgi:NAD(P)-dependent dehydrogenase (short-subunit alcohol dehydrogenase family)